MQRVLFGAANSGRRHKYYKTTYDYLPEDIHSFLEDELIRALGPASVEAVLDSQGNLGAFRTFQKQPAWRGRRTDAQLRRFMGSADRRKIRYARLLVDALDLAQVPRPLDRVLAHV